MRLGRRRRKPDRAELIERKHRLAGEIRSLQAEVERGRRRGLPVADLEGRLARLRDEHYRARLHIDRA